VKKKYIFILLLIIIFFAVININQNVEEGSVTLKVKEGIRLAKKHSYQEADKHFKDAILMLNRQGFKLYKEDITEFASLVSKFKNKDKKYVMMFQLLAKDLQDKINNLKVSKDINSDILEQFCGKINQLLLREDLNSILLVDDKEKKLKFKKIILARKISHLSPKENNLLNQYINRLYLSHFFKLYFLEPVSKNEIILNSALSLFSARDYKKCNKILEEILEDNKHYVKAYILLSRSYEKTKRNEDSILLLEKGLESMPSNEQLLAEVAYYYNKSGRDAEAIKSIEKALEVNPSYQYALAIRKDMERDEKSSLKSIKFYQNQLDNGDKSIFNLSNLSLALRKVNKVEECSNIVLQGRELFPEDPFFMKMQGWIDASKKNYKDAISILLKAKQKAGKKDPEIFLLLGITYFNQNLEDESYDILKEGVTMFPEDKSLLFNIALICEMSSSHHKEAITFYQDFLLKFKDNKLSIKVQKKIENLRKKG